MKKPLSVLPASFGLLTQAELSKLASEARGYETHAAFIEAAQIRKEEAAAGRASDPQAALPPHGNTGGKSLSVAARLVMQDGEVVEIPARRGWGGDSSFLDWCNFVCKETDFYFGAAPVTDEEVISMISHRCASIFGYGVTKTRGFGANFYDESYVLGEGYGLVCHGGNRATVLISISGTGCAAAREGWEKRLYDFLTEKKAHLTRVDLAHDVYDGIAYSVDKADTDFDIDLFNCGGRNPDIEHRGNWKRPNGKGRTVYIGHRENGKYARIYEKGKQLGGPNSPWCRVELEYKSKQRIIPLDVLLKPGEYLAAAYPAFTWISERQERILTTQKETQITYERMLEWLRRQCGAALFVGQLIEGGADALLKKVMQVDKIPARLKIPGWQFEGTDYFHNRGKAQSLPVELMYEACLT